jgi:predicted lactoylglutathione lyase
LVPAPVLRFPGLRSRSATSALCKTDAVCINLCFRARERADVDAVHAFLLKTGAKIVHPPEDGPWAPGYYSVLFEDPDGIRLEVKHVPGKGLLASKTDGVSLIRVSASSVEPP